MKTLFVKFAEKRTNTVYDSQSEQVIHWAVNFYYK